MVRWVEVEYDTYILHLVPPEVRRASPHMYQQAMSLGWSHRTHYRLRRYQTGDDQANGGSMWTAIRKKRGKIRFPRLPGPKYKKDRKDGGDDGGKDGGGGAAAGGKTYAAVAAEGHKRDQERNGTSTTAGA